MNVYTVGLDPITVSYALCERVIERDAKITHFAVHGWWRVIIEGLRFEGGTRREAVQEAALDLQRRIEADGKDGGR